VCDKVKDLAYKTSTAKHGVWGCQPYQCLRVRRLPEKMSIHSLSAAVLDNALGLQKRDNFDLLSVREPNVRTMVVLFRCIGPTSISRSITIWYKQSTDYCDTYFGHDRQIIKCRRSCSQKHGEEAGADARYYYKSWFRSDGSDIRFMSKARQ
jgi:hypothetical protein